MHLFACLWFCIINLENKFVPTPDFFFGQTPQMQRLYDSHESSLFF